MRTGMIGAYNLGALNAFNETLVVANRVSGEPGADLKGLFYALAFQNGIDQFMVNEQSADYVEQIGKSDFFEQRIAYVNDDQFRKHRETISESFSQFLGEGWETQMEFSPFWKWIAFLTDLLIAMETRTCVLSASGIPQIEEIMEIAPTELVTPLKFLTDQFEPIAVASTVPKLAIEREHIERYNEVLGSDLFDNYVQAELAIEADESSPRGLLDNLRSKARELVLAYPMLLSTGNAVSNLIKCTPQLIDTAFGGLPGTIAEAAAAGAEHYRKEKNQIIVYDFQQSLEIAMLENLVRMLEKGDVVTTESAKPTPDSIA